MRRILSNSGLVLVIAGLCWFASARTLPGQEKADPAALQAKAQQSLDNQQLLETEKQSLAATKAFEQLLTSKRPDDALLLRWCRCRNELGEVQAYLLKLSEAQALFTSTLAYLKQVAPLRPKEPAFRHELAKTHHSLYKSYRHMQLYMDSITHLREAIDLLDKLASAYPDQTQYRLTLAQWLTSQGAALTELAQYPEAEAAFQKAARLAEKLVADAPQTPEFAYRLALVHNAHALLVRESGRYLASIEMIRTAIGILAKLEREHPEQPEFWHPLPKFYRNVAQPLGYTNNTAEVETAKREALRLEAKLAQVPEAARRWVRDSDKILGSIQSGDVERFAKQQQEVEAIFARAEKESQTGAAAPYVQGRMATAKGIRAMQLLARGLSEDGRQELRQAIAIMEKVNAQHPGLPVNRNSQADLLCSYGLSYLLYGDYAAGNKIIQQAVGVLEKLASDYPQAPQIRFRISECLLRASMTVENQREYIESARYFAAAQVVIKKLAEDYPRCPNYRRHHAQGYLTLGKTYYMAKAHAEAEAALREGVRLWPKVVADFPAIPEFRDNMGSAYGTLGQILFRREKYQEAEAAFASMLQIHQQLLADYPNQAERYASLAISCNWVAQMREKQERHAEAIECYAKVIAALDTALKMNPRQRTWLTHQRTAIQARAYLLLKLGKLAEYQSDLERARAIGETLEPPVARFVRIEHRAQKGEISLALKEADELFQNLDLAEAQWRHLAVFYVNASAQMTDAGQRDALQARAVAALRRAVEQGYARARLSEDAQLQPLAPRDDFRKLLQGK